LAELAELARVRFPKRTDKFSWLKKEINIIHGVQAGRFDFRKAEVTFALGVVPLVNE
jgi:hypothetical protein